MRTLQRRFALIRRYVLGVSLLVPLLFAQGAQPQAAIVQFDGILATGITALSVGSQSFTIDFVRDTYDAAFPGEELFSNAADFQVAIDAALNAALAPLISSTGSADPVWFYSIPVVFPDSPTFDNVFFQRSACTAEDVAGTIFCTAAYAPLDSFTVPRDSIVVSWAVPTLSAVPLPAALPLFGSALAMLGIVGWRRKRRGGA